MAKTKGPNGVLTVQASFADSRLRLIGNKIERTYDPQSKVEEREERTARLRLKDSLRAKIS